MKTLILEIARGIRIAVPSDPRNISTYVFLEQEDWFEEEAAFIGRVAEPGGRMLDIGASYGFYSLNYARAAGAASRVWAFEPTPEVCALFRESSRLNALANISLIETAIGAESGRARLAIGASSELNAINPEQGGIDVAVASLDSLDREHGFGAVDFVKLDVEGHEIAALTGGAAFFTRESPLVMMEVTMGNEGDFAAPARLESLGYSLYRLVPQLGILIPYERAWTDKFLLNIFACKPDRAARLAARGLLCPADNGPAPMASVADVVAWIRRVPALASQAAFFEGLIANSPPENQALVMMRLELASRDVSIPIAGRCAALERAAEIAREFLTPHATLAGSCTAARVLRGWGQRGVASDTLREFYLAVAKGAELTIDAPFMPPLASYDTWAADIANWVKAGIIEAVSLWHVFSSRFSNTDGAPVSDVLSRFGRQSALFERRRQLRRMIDGEQFRQEWHPLLRSKRPDNLNPGFWCGAVA